ncbi:MAG: hypothetical protein A2060_04325 [Planctomycetes bacterium GWA2_50_13]|nr:MAG: hypothetical protein A2060_04325 [Planctomycetes bacterium GWA2_50_13]OHB91840.1 MAG: hypothetical protein A3E75_05320 [Planctomycetes bacterium RIFCSPHIGHO2_12_FULL_51_37]HCN19455.1 hypothetical protein [Planctomycetia bacterium]
MGLWSFSLFVIWAVASIGLSLSVLVGQVLPVPWVLQCTLAGLNIIFWGLLIYDDITWRYGQ